MPANGYLSVSLHAGTDRPALVGQIHAGDKYAMIGLDLALGTDHRHVASKSTKRKALELDCRLLTPLQQDGIIFRNGYVHGDVRSLHDLGKSIALGQAAAYGILHMRRSDDPCQGSPNDGAVQTFLSAG